MPSLIDLRRRVRAVKNTQQITKAMKMVAASKLRRAQERMMSARPYAQQMQRVLGSVASRVDPSAHPLLAVRELTPSSKTLVIVVSADKGLCGSFNTNIIKAAGAYVVDSPLACELGLVGRKARDYFGRRRFATTDQSTNVFWLALPSFGEAWHHNHHAFPRSAFHGLRWYQVDLAGWVILAMEKLGLVWNVVRISPERQAQLAAPGASPPPRISVGNT